MEFKDRKIAELTHNLNLFDQEEILDIAIEQVPKIIEAHRVSIYLVDGSEKYLLSKRHSSKRLQEHLAEKISVESEKSLIPQVFIKKRPLLITNVAEYIIKNNLPIKLSKRQRYTSGSCMLVPIEVKLPKDYTKIIGVINFAEKADFTPFSKVDLELAIRLGEIVGTALHNCNVIEKKLGGRQKELMSELDRVKKAYEQKEINLDEAKKKQDQMLPEIPVIPEYDIHVLYTPMETIGGDFYDFFSINDHEIGIVVGDVSGHGIEAALVMSMAKHILSIYSKIHRSLTETLCHANEEICASLKGNSFIAVFLGILNTKTNVLRFARAGQTYPLIYNPNREKEPFELHSQGMVLGTARGDMFKSRIEEKTFQLMPEDIILLYTDGVVEAPDADEEEYSLERLMQAVSECSDLTSKEISDEIAEKVRQHTAGPQSDDITIMTIKTKNIKVNEVMIVEEESSSMEAYVVAPELTFDEEMQYQMLSFEEQISEVEEQRDKEREERLKWELKCQELQKELDLAINDPDSLIRQLKDQLQISVELPRNLINENKELHEKIEKQKREIRKLEIEIDDFAENAELLDSERKKIKEDLQQRESFWSGFRQRLIDHSNNVRHEILNYGEEFDKEIQECLEKNDYYTAYSTLEQLLDQAIEGRDHTRIYAVHRQIFIISKVFHAHFQDLLKDI